MREITKSVDNSREKSEKVRESAVHESEIATEQLRVYSDIRSNAISELSAAYDKIKDKLSQAADVSNKSDACENTEKTCVNYNNKLMRETKLLPTNEVNNTDSKSATTKNNNIQSLACDDKVRDNKKISAALESAGQFTKNNKRNTYETEKLRNSERADSTIDYVKIKNNNNKFDTHSISVYTVEIRDTAKRKNNLDDKSKLKYV